LTKAAAKNKKAEKLKLFEREKEKQVPFKETK
jgi:hypothetical protein